MFFLIIHITTNGGRWFYFIGYSLELLFQDAMLRLHLANMVHVNVSIAASINISGGFYFKSCKIPIILIDRCLLLKEFHLGLFHIKYHRLLQCAVIIPIWATCATSTHFPRQNGHQFGTCHFQKDIGSPKAVCLSYLVKNKLCDVLVSSVG